MFEGLCGQLPYQAQSLMELVTKLSEGRHPKPTELRPELSPELEQVILRAMHREPGQRFANMYTLGAALSSADRMDRKFGWYEWDRGESTIAELVDLVERHK
jgi:serine/threonine-protein kinase